MPQKVGGVSTSVLLALTARSSLHCLPNFLESQISWKLSPWKPPPKKKHKTEATVAEEQEAVASGERNPLETIYVYTPKYPVPVDLGVEKDFLPVNSQREEPNEKGDIVTKSYYTCVICNHSSQNRASTINHTR